MGGGGDGALYLCDVHGSDIKIRQTLSKHTQFVHDVSFAPDGKTFFSAGEDKSVKVWSTATGALVHEWSDLRFAVHGVACAPDSRHVAFANANSTIYLLRLTKPLETAGK
jgi:WD40 repeat protein